MSPRDPEPQDPATQLTVRFTGKNANDATAVSEALLALDDLYGTIAETMGLEDAHLKLVGFSMFCDGCENKQPAEHAAWINRGGLDFCGECQTNGRIDAVLGGDDD
jgi:hypothetical protein